MFTKEILIDNLIRLGFKADEVDAVIADVAHIIMNKALGYYLLRLPENERTKLAGLSEEGIVKYVEESTTTLPKVSNEEFEKLYNQTWNEYFAAVGK